MTIGYDKALYVLPFDHRATFSKTLFGWQGPLTAEQTAAPRLVGFAVGRTTFRGPLVGHRAKQITHETAVARIAASYRARVDLFEIAK